MLKWIFMILVSFFITVWFDSMGYTSLIIGVIIIVVGMLYNHFATKKLHFITQIGIIFMSTALVFALLKWVTTI